jgi:hypothetical protein
MPYNSKQDVFGIFDERKNIKKGPGRNFTEFSPLLAIIYRKRVVISKYSICFKINVIHRIVVVETFLEEFYKNIHLLTRLGLCFWAVRPET